MYYCGIDLGGSKSQVCVIDEDERNQINTKVPSDITSVLSVLKAFPRKEVRIVAESTFNWDWLADGLQEAGYDLTLAHSLGMHAISYAKVKTDKRDARTLARLLRGNLIPESYICPPERRALRDLLRSRWRLVDHRAREYRAIRYMLYRQGRWDHNLAQVKALETEDAAWISEKPNLAAIGGHALERIELLTRQIADLECDLKTGICDAFGRDYDNLRTVPGIGLVIGLTIILESGDVARFPDSRKYSSYARVVPGCANSSTVQKRGRNSKQGNRFLKWAYMHAATKAVQHDDDFKQLHARYQKRHSNKGCKIVAYNTIAHRIAQVAYHIMRDGTPFTPEKLFAHKHT